MNQVRYYDEWVVIKNPNTGLYSLFMGDWGYTLAKHQTLVSEPIRGICVPCLDDHILVLCENRQPFLLRLSDYGLSECLTDELQSCQEGFGLSDEFLIAVLTKQQMLDLCDNPMFTCKNEWVQYLKGDRIV